MTTLSTVIGLLERATEGSRELSRIVAELVGWTETIVGDESRGYVVPRFSRWLRPDGTMLLPGQLPPAFTESMDAAMSLVEGKPWHMIYGDADDAPGYTAWAEPLHRGLAKPTPALALCLAVLRAREMMKE